MVSYNYVESQHPKNNQTKERKNEVDELNEIWQTELNYFVQKKRLFQRKKANK